VAIDGTLVDSNYQHALAWWRALRDAGRTVPLARLHRLIGMGADQLLEAVVGGPDPALEQASGEHFRQLRDEVTVLPGAEQLLRALAERDFVVVLATSGRQDDVSHMRGLLDADRWIAAEVNSAEAAASKPAPDIFRLALERSGASPTRAVVIGDTGWDIDAAGRCGVPCVAVTTGGWSAVELERRGAVEVYDDAAAIVAHLDDGAIGLLARAAGH
jgi:HAD superfamily hydrolase (TIGR01509 family)